MIGNNLERVIFPVSRRRYFGGACYQATEQVDVIVAVHALHHGCQPLQTHTGIHRGMRQGIQLALCIPVILHEDQVPDFDITVPVFFRRSRRPTRDVRPMIVEDFGAGSTGSGCAHGPEIVPRADAPEACGVDLDFLQPDISGLVIPFKNRDP